MSIKTHHPAQRRPCRKGSCDALAPQVEGRMSGRRCAAARPHKMFVAQPGLVPA
jgi:hypothetical protein